MTERLTGIISGAEGDIPLTEAALLVASHRYPDLDVRHYLDVINGFGESVSARITADCGPSEKVAALNSYLFDELGFTPNAKDYYDPRNSLLNELM